MWLLDGLYIIKLKTPVKVRRLFKGAAVNFRELLQSSEKWKNKQKRKIVWKCGAKRGKKKKKAYGGVADNAQRTLHFR